MSPQLVSELATQEAEEKKLSSQQAEAAERFGFFQQTRNALSDLCGMLRVKVCMCMECLACVRYPGWTSMLLPSPIILE